MKKTKVLLLSGFSLVETLVVIVMFSILTIIATQITARSLSGSQKSDSSTEVRQNMEYAISVIERNVRNASVITSPCTAGGSNGTTIAYQDDKGAAGSFICQPSGSGYFLAQDTGTSRLTSDNIFLTNCSFTCTSSGNPQDPPQIRVDVTGQKNSGDPLLRSPVTISTVIYLRTY